MLYLRDAHGLSFRISAMTPELGSKAAALNSLVLQRWQLNKLATQATNRLHQFLLAVFPEGEARYFNKLLKVTPYYPTPKDILDSNVTTSRTAVGQKFELPDDLFACIIDSRSHGQLILTDLVTVVIMPNSITEFLLSRLTSGIIT